MRDKQDYFRILREFRYLRIWISFRSSSEVDFLKFSKDGIFDYLYYSQLGSCTYNGSAEESLPWLGKLPIRIPWPLREWRATLVSFGTSLVHCISLVSSQCTARCSLACSATYPLWATRTRRSEASDSKIPEIEVSRGFFFILRFSLSGMSQKSHTLLHSFDLLTDSFTKPWDCVWSRCVWHNVTCNMNIY